ncbi:hypothetical protein JCM7686_0370 [Paracoccus aminophilus JCM 7686]|uniref:Endonuclease/exonuclease/phosphatase domain-containing protein n=1 Tax=Paracoccus aminophilus JCM 7686 TaxID=1367847 RepID=S5XJW8_PARAH|nr:hypothetical protein JCM7686_0370 [Paracoccus aminophilus JCM 7686]
MIARADPDILLLTGMDWDRDLLALKELQAQLAKAGADYPHLFAARPNSGMATGLDLDQNGRLGTADDAQGYGSFSGQSGMALLSRHPFGEITDYSAFLWRDLPGNRMPDLPAEISAVQRLSSVAHWDVPVIVAGKPLHLLAYSASPPVFGHKDRNRRRNHDETAFWLQHLPEAPFVVLGDTNLDPLDGDGAHEAITALLAQVQDPAPVSEGGRLAPQTGVNASHRGDPAQDTAQWRPDKAGNLRVDVVLPAPGLRVRDSAVLWPTPDDPVAETVALASRHRLVWLDLDWP